MGNDYTINEQLTRAIALDRLKHLSDVYLEAKERNDPATMRLVTEERQAIRNEFLKVVK